MNNDEYFMSLALEQAKIAKSKNEVPVGSVVVYKNKVISRAYNLVENNANSLAHAEYLALDKAIKVNGYKHLHEYELYVTLEPCSMCAGAIVLSRLKRLIYGANDNKSGACGSVFNIVQSENLNHYVDITSNVLEKECSKILKDFFKDLRNKN